MFLVSPLFYVLGMMTLAATVNSSMITKRANFALTSAQHQKKLKD